MLRRTPGRAAISVAQHTKGSAAGGIDRPRPPTSCRIGQFWPSSLTRASAACRSPEYQSQVSITSATAMPRSTVNWWTTGPSGVGCGDSGAVGMPTDRFLAASDLAAEGVARAVPPACLREIDTAVARYREGDDTLLECGP